MRLSYIFTIACHELIIGVCKCQSLWYCTPYIFLVSKQCFYLCGWLSGETYWRITSFLNDVYTSSFLPNEKHTTKLTIQSWLPLCALSEKCQTQKCTYFGHLDIWHVIRQGCHSSGFNSCVAILCVLGGRGMYILLPIKQWRQLLCNQPVTL